jgi:hypothetical protein
VHLARGWQQSPERAARNDDEQDTNDCDHGPAPQRHEYIRSGSEQKRSLDLRHYPLTSRTFCRRMNLVLSIA